MGTIQSRYHLSRLNGSLTFGWYNIVWAHLAITILPKDGTELNMNSHSIGLLQNCPLSMTYRKFELHVM